MMGWRMRVEVVGRWWRLVMLFRRGFIRWWSRLGLGLVRRVARRRRRGEMVVNGMRSLLHRWGWRMNVMVLLLHRWWRSRIPVGWMRSGKGRDLVGIIKPKRKRYIISI
jgi:hypothetical protein